MNLNGPIDGLTPEQKRELLRNLLQQRSVASSCFPMSLGQQGLWHAFRRDPNSTAYNVFLPSRIRSRLDIDALERSIVWLAQRHASLRTTFSAESGELKQTVHPQLAPEFTITDASGADDEALRALVLEQTQRPFDLTTGPLIRVACLRRSETDCVVVATTHHIVVDFWSLILMMSEIRTAYSAFASGGEPELPAASNNYHEFVDHQRQRLDSPLSQTDRQYWKSSLSGIPTVLDWVTDYHRPESFTGRADVVTFSMQDGFVDKIKQSAAKFGTTPNAVVMAALSVFIARSTGQDAFLVGTPFSGRSQQRFENTVGFFVNMLPIPADVSANPCFADFVSTISQHMFDALQHEQLPLSEIVRQVGPKRDAGRTPLFQVSCTFEKAHLRSEEGRAGFLMDSQQSYVDEGGLNQEGFFVRHPTCHHDVEFVFEFAQNELRGLICYCRDLFQRDTVEQMSQNFQTLFTQLLRSPDERVKSVAWNDKRIESSHGHARVDSPEETLKSLLFGPAECEYADRPAMQLDDVVLTYREVLDRALRLAAHLNAAKVGIGDFVPVCAPRGADAMIGILGVMASGAAFIPIDSSQPAVSFQQLQCDTTIPFAIVDDTGSWQESVPADRRIELRDVMKDSPSSVSKNDDVSPNDLAYVIYTSGSTGTPKGVMVPHRGIANTLRWRSRDVPLLSDDRVLMLLSHQFDAAIGVAFTTLAQGATLVWPDAGVFRDPDSLIDQIIRDSITILPAVPSLIRVLLQRPRFRKVTSVRQIWCGGEAMPSDLPRLVRQITKAELWNFYGPTECSVEATAYCATDHPANRRVPIGTEIDGAEIRIVNEFLQPNPPTVPGQIAITGRGLATGYLADPMKTQNSFVALPDANNEQRVYLTGDIGRRRVDGQIEFLRRDDGQVKLGGYRIELEEIERVVANHPQVSAAACKILNADSPSAMLVAFVVPDGDDGEPSAQLNDAMVTSLTRFVAEKLPSYKRPQVFSGLTELPTGTSGKLLRNQLPEIVSQSTRQDVGVLPQTELERFLADLWAETLQLPAVGVTENFFQLGGSSLQAAMLTQTLSDILGVDVPTALLFDLADISQLSRRLVELYESQMEERFGRHCVEWAKRSIHSDSESDLHPLLAPLKPSGELRPLFMIHPPGGIVACYRELADAMPAEQPLWAIRSRGLHGTERLPETIDEMSNEYIAAIRTIQSDGPYQIGGWSLGGVVAYEIARQMMSAGLSVDRLVLLDTTIPERSADEDANAVGLEYGIDLSLRDLAQLSEDEILPMLYRHAEKLGVLAEETPPALVEKIIADLKRLFRHHVELASQYELQPLDVDVLLVRPTDVPMEAASDSQSDRGWSKWVRQVDVQYVSGHHHSMVQQPHVKQLADALTQPFPATR
ncbi:non-ribosomal peptide synthetase [Stieleria varia]|uniref:Dimodular nonribosomal peptide synthase n=1 Tax=Stieleria varia TaxID=2528005 RepID=A0A5C6A302_9BACT|nr:non-ribosomal peptide synthetase [Stieleria varia]TWT93745.1 Dimodular nonribosomal peptide synthase [Stieleria varia]